MANRPNLLRPAGVAVIGVVAIALLLTATPRSSALAAGDPRTADFTAVDAHVRASMEGSAVPGLAYAVVQDGAIVHLAAFGSAGPGGRAMTAQTPVVIGSVGKSITALAVRQLVEVGRIDAASPVTRYLPWFRLAAPGSAVDGVTIQALLDHTSGLSTADGQDPRWYVPGRTPEDVVRALVGIPANRPAGTYEYSNLNYVILGAVVEAVSGESYGDYLRAHIFDPLGMTRSFTSLDAAAAAEPAQGHRYLFGVPVPFDEPYPSGMIAAGYQVSTAEDMARYAAALANGGVIDGVDVVSPGGPPSEARAYGTDWQPLTPAKFNAIVSQSGSTLNSNAVISELASERLAVIVLLNANPTQLGMPAGAADIALDVLRLASDVGPGASSPSVVTVYLVLDAILALLAAAFVIHASRSRTWRRRYAESSHRLRLVARTLVADLALPVVVLLGFPLWIGSTGSSPAGDVLAGWRFAFWTSPDVAASCLVLTLGALALGAGKVVVAQVRRA